MLPTPALTVCVPSRNRQEYFQITIRDLLNSMRTDVQFVFADNSDEPEIMNDFMVEYVKDPRVVFLSAPAETLSMRDNWERCVEQATGDYVTVIGDDDFIDVDVVDYMNRVLAYNPGVDAFGWRLVSYTWPHPGRPNLTMQVPFDDCVVRLDQADLYRRMFGWVDAVHIPTCGFSIYHHAISRKLLDRIHRVYGNRYFEHAVVDYDIAFKIICQGSFFVATSRPFGVMGSCPKSNSFAVGKHKDYRKKIGQFTGEARLFYEESAQFRDFPFSIELGTTAAVALAQVWFKNKYHISYENWGEGFAGACAMDCGAYTDRDDFEAACEGYRTAFSLWEGGRYLRFFNPSRAQLHVDSVRAISSGFNDVGVYIDQNLPVSTPSELMGVVRGIVTPIDMMPIQPEGVKSPNETENRVFKMLYG